MNRTPCDRYRELLTSRKGSLLLFINIIIIELISFHPLCVFCVYFRLMKIPPESIKWLVHPRCRWRETQICQEKKHRDGVCHGRHEVPKTKTVDQKEAQSPVSSTSLRLTPRTLILTISLILKCHSIRGGVYRNVQRRGGGWGGGRGVYSDLQRESYSIYMHRGASIVWENFTRKKC